MYEMSIPVTLERQTLSQYLNNFGVLGGTLRQMERDLSDDWGESTKKIQKHILGYQRIVGELKERYKNECQIEDCGYTFEKRGGGFYSEGHHLIWRSEGGGPEQSNVVILCPNHHRMFHYADVMIEDPVGDERNVTINGVRHSILYKV